MKNQKNEQTKSMMKGAFLFAIVSTQDALRGTLAPKEDLARLDHTVAEIANGHINLAEAPHLTQ